MDPKGYRLPVNVMIKLKKMILNGQITDNGPAKHPALAERKRFIHDFIMYLNGTPVYDEP